MSASKCVSEDRLIDFVDGEVAGDEAARIERHLEECPACRASVESLRRILGAAGLDKVPEPEPAYWAYFARNVAGRVKSRAESRKRRFRLVLIPGLATVAVCAVLVVMFHRGPDGPAGDVESIIADLNASVVTEEVLLESGVDVLVFGQFGTDAGLLNEYLTETAEPDELVGELDEDEERALINKLNNLMELRGSIESEARKEC